MDDAACAGETENLACATVSMESNSTSLLFILAISLALWSLFHISSIMCNLKHICFVLCDINFNFTIIITIKMTLGADFRARSYYDPF